MNGKQAKKLRRAAIGMAATLIQSGREIKIETEHMKPQKPHPIDQEEAPLEQHTEVNRKDTLRGIYRYLKNKAK